MTQRPTLVACGVLVALMFGTSARLLSQAPGAATNAPAASTSSLVGTWQGTITINNTNTLRIGLIVTSPGAGALSATLVVIDQDGARIPVQQTMQNGKAVHLEIAAIKGSYDGVLDPGDTQISGTLVQGMSTTLNFKRVDKLDAPPDFGAKENADVRTVVDEYFRTFTVKDFDAFGALFQPPYTMWAVGGASTVLMTRDDIVNRYRTLRTSLDGTDYAVSKAVAMTVTPLSSNAALVDIHWRRDKKDGSLFGEGGEIMTLLRTPAGWKITSNLGRQLSQYGKVF
jgi:hypothetical protein